MAVYVPPPTVRNFLLDNSRRRIIHGPVGSGKTVGCGPIEIMRRAAMQAPDPTGIRRSRWAVVRNTARQLSDTTIKTFLDWIPNGYAGTYRIVDKIFVIQYNDVHAEVMFRALDDAADKKNLLSLELTGAFFNEAREIDRDIVDLMDTRIGRFPRKDNGGPTWYGMWADTNSPNEGEYWYYVLENLHPDKFTEDKSWKVFRQPSGLSPEAENIENLPVGYYPNFIDGKSEEFVNVYVANKYGRMRLGKPVHPMFKRERHVALKELLANPFTPLLLAFDFGRTPACVFSQMDAFGRMLVLDEVTTEGVSLDTCLKEYVLPKLRNRFSHIPDIRVTGDPSGGWGVQTDEQTCKDIFKKNGLPKVTFPNSNKSDFRQESLDNFLHLETQAGPAFLVDPRCKMLIKALEGAYHFKQDRKGNMQEEVDKAHPWSDIAESCEYAAIHWAGGDNKLQWRQRMDAIKQQARSHAGAYTTRV